MDVHTPPSRLTTSAAVAAPAADVAGHMLAPSLLATWPALVVALSPSDPHLLLATGQSRLALAVIAFAVRLGRAWAIFKSADHLAHRSRHQRLRRLLTPRAKSRWRHHTGIGAVMFLPGMVAAIIAARAQLRPRLYLSLAASSTATGLMLTFTAAHIFGEQLARVSDAITSHPTEFTVVVGTAALAGLLRRWRTTAQQTPD